MLDPQLHVFFGLFGSCLGWLGGLVLLVVGFVPVRKAHPTAGYLIGGAGALHLLQYCCSSWIRPAVFWFDMYELADSLDTPTFVAVVLAHFASVALIIAGAVMLAQRVSAEGAS